MPSIYLKVKKIEKTDVLKLRFSKFIEFLSWSVFGDHQLTQISLNFNASCCNLKADSRLG